MDDITPLGISYVPIAKGVQRARLLEGAPAVDALNVVGRPAETSKQTTFAEYKQAVRDGNFDPDESLDSPRTVVGRKEQSFLRDELKPGWAARWAAADGVRVQSTRPEGE
ncbi:hypothetical protein [Candidatus Nephthysia bennettiae]|uniref:hypothetical protein n=1 Tax=Candidatus Nephthysia bennettiae TaxID=3127016 RepID=UPI001A35C1A7|nr:hypothetical protein [Candidatus Dormibacteraeota bacterium]